MIQTLEQIKKIVRELLQTTANVNIAAIADSHPLVNVANFDSMAALLFLSAVEHQFKVSIDTKNIDQVLYSIDTLSEFLFSHQ